MLWAFGSPLRVVEQLAHGRVEPVRRAVELECSLGDELEDDGRDEGLRHACDREAMRGGQGSPGLDVGETGRLLPAPLRADGQGDHAGHTGVHDRLEVAVERRAVDYPARRSSSCKGAEWNSTATASSCSAAAPARSSSRTRSSTACRLRTSPTSTPCASAGCSCPAGPFRDQEDETFRGICIYRTGLEETRELANSDPSVQAGRMRVEVVTWLTPAGEVAFPGSDDEPKEAA